MGFRLVYPNKLSDKCNDCASVESTGGQHGRVGADCKLHPLIHTFGSRLMPLDVMVGQKGLDYESLRFFLRIPIEMVQTLHFQ